MIIRNLDKNLSIKILSTTILTYLTPALFVYSIVMLIKTFSQSQNQNLEYFLHLFTITPKP